MTFPTPDLGAAGDVDEAAAEAIRERWDAVRTRVADAALAAGRDPAGVDILVATKTQPVAAIRAAVSAGARLIGENRVQELVAKAPGVADLVAAGSLRVHLIGTLQRNKVNSLLGAGVTSCVQSVDGTALAGALSRRRGEADAPLDVLVQVNVSNEPTKSGIPPSAAPELARSVATVPGLRLAGFMTIGAHSTDERLVRRGFADLRRVRDTVLASGEPGTQDALTLSMGMSADLEWAVAEGSTMVRVGAAVFGPRLQGPPSVPNVR